MTIDLVVHGDTPRATHKDAEGTYALPDEAGDITSVFDGSGMDEVTFYVENTTDTQVKYTIQGAPQAFAEDERWHNLGAAILLDAGNVTTTTDYAVLTDYHPRLRVKVQTNTGEGTATEGEARVYIAATKA